jgi:DNA-binding NtrC family response regulator
MQENSVVMVTPDSDLLRTAVLTLEGEGYRAFGFAQQDSAFAHVAQLPPRAIVLDLSAEAARASAFFEQLKERKAIPVVGIVSNGENIGKGGNEDPVYDYVTKPLSGFALARAVGHAIAHRDLSDEVNRLKAALEIKVQQGDSFQLPILPESGVNLRNVERELLARALEKFRGNQTRTARYLNISRRTLIYRIGKYNLKPLATTGMIAS